MNAATFAWTLSIVSSKIEPSSAIVSVPTQAPPTTGAG